MESKNEPIIHTASSIVPIISPPKSTDTTSTRTTTLIYQIPRPLSTPSTPPSGFSPILPLDLPFETPPGAHTLSPSDSSPLTLPQGEPN